MNRFLFWFAGLLPCRIISDDGRPYLERYYLSTLFGVRFYLHRFVGSDPARGLHDHPWAWAGSVVLAGWYWEERRGSTKHHKVRWFNWLLGDSFHRVILPLVTTSITDKDGYHTQWGQKEQPCWTLFFHRAENVKPWGFLRPMTGYTSMFWVPHDYPGTGASSGDRWWLYMPNGKNNLERQQ